MVTKPVTMATGTITMVPSAWMVNMGEPKTAEFKMAESKMAESKMVDPAPSREM